ncbi:MAG: 4Fe-4S dicluster domain-containing protein [Flexilinea sp.]|nr:4Fe-4S dicluster domain-containing protein [Flexilinea sp.]
MIEILILRRENRNAKPYWQRFTYEPQTSDDTLASVLTALNAREDLQDADGNPAAPIRWECSCLQKKCGACAMVIDGRPRLACGARLSEFKKTIRVEPLRKFPVVADLMVDRSVMFQNLKELQLWFESEANGKDKAMPIAYQSSRCLQCGCCLEVCPNFRPDGKFTGMASAVPMTRVLAQIPDTQKKEMTKAYRLHVYEGCGKSLSCRNICPAGLDIDEILLNSNAIAVWKRFL